MKIRDVNELLTDLGITLEYCCGTYKGRNVRYLEDRGVFQIGNDCFDRWANSVCLEFEVWLPKGQRQLERWAKTFEA
jgi:hypothetical protein